MIFKDILQKENVDSRVMQPIYNRIWLSAMGTVQNYQLLYAEAGFGKL